jgi:hypothetical protein
MPRLFTRAQKAVISERQGGICAIEGCEAPIDQYDHTLPHALGGGTVLENASGMCAQHHREKTKADVRRIRKADRQAKCVGPRPPSKRPIKGRSQWPEGRKLQSRGFQKRERP